jgi:hypothetical protein
METFYHKDCGGSWEVYRTGSEKYVCVVFTKENADNMVALYNRLESERINNLPLEETVYVLKYPKEAPDKSISGYESWHPNYAGQYIAIDRGSGGYPYSVDTARRAELFDSLENALDYRRHWVWMEVHKVEMKISKCN